MTTHPSVRHPEQLHLLVYLDLEPADLDKLIEDHIDTGHDVVGIIMKPTDQAAKEIPTRHIRTKVEASNGGHKFAVGNEVVHIGDGVTDGPRGVVLVVATDPLNDDTSWVRLGEGRAPHTTVYGQENGVIQKFIEGREEWIEEVKRQTILPHAMADQLPLFADTRASKERRKTRLKAGTVEGKRNPRTAEVEQLVVSVSLDAATLRKVYKERAPHQAVLSFDTHTTGTTHDEVIDAALSTLSALDTDCFLTLMAIFQMGTDHGGKIVENLAGIARMRGMSDAKISKGGRPMQRIRTHFELASRVEFVFDYGEGREMRHPLLVKTGEARVRGKRKREDGTPRSAGLYSLNPWLFDEQTLKAGRVLFYDPSLLRADPQKDELAVRLLLYVSGRWSRSWIGHRLDREPEKLREVDGVGRHKVGTILDKVGLLEQQQTAIKKEGPAVFRERFGAQMQKLIEGFGGGPLIGGFDLEERDDPLDDLLIVWPTDAVATRLTLARPKSITARDKRDQKTGLPAAPAVVDRASGGGGDRVSGSPTL